MAKLMTGIGVQTTSAWNPKDKTQAIDVSFQADVNFGYDPQKRHFLAKQLGLRRWAYDLPTDDMTALAQPPLRPGWNEENHALHVVFLSLTGSSSV